MTWTDGLSITEPAADAGAPLTSRGGDERRNESAAGRSVSSAGDSLFGFILFGLICGALRWFVGPVIELDPLVLWCVIFGAYGLGWLMRDDHDEDLEDADV